MAIGTRSVVWCASARLTRSRLDIRSRPGMIASMVSTGAIIRGAMAPRAEIREHRGRRKLFVAGRPFLALGIQIDFLNTTRVEDFDWLFAHIVKLGCNTVFFPVRWFVLEPEEGRFNWVVVDHAVARCRELGLRMALLWFGTNQGGRSGSAPKWVREGRFRRMQDPDGKDLPGLCPTQPDLLAVEKRALDSLLARVAERDGDATILLQCENEPCIRMDATPSGAGAAVPDTYQPRCMCSACTTAFRTEGGSEFAFGVRSLTRYFTGLLAGQKRLLPVPAYANFPTNPLRSGEDVALWLDECPAIDFVAPDYYGFSPSDLAFTMRHFAAGRNLPFVAEHSTESTGDADLNLFLAVLEHGAAGFDPWAIDHAFGWRHWRDHVYERPFVTRDGSWTDAATAYGRVQSSLHAIAAPLADALGGDGVMHYAAAAGIPRKMEERRWGFHWTVLSGPASRWVAVRTGDGEATISGVDAQVTVGPLAPGVSLALSEGRWDGNTWREDRLVPADGEPRGLASGWRSFALAPGRAYRVRPAPATT